MDSQSCSRLVRPYISALTISTDYVSLMERRARAFSSSISPPPTRQFGAKRSASSDSRVNFAVTQLRETRCPLMGWFGRAPAPPVTNLARGSKDKGARHVPEPQQRDRRDRHRYRQKLIPCRRAG